MTEARKDNDTYLENVLPRGSCCRPSSTGISSSICCVVFKQNTFSETNVLTVDKIFQWNVKMLFRQIKMYRDRRFYPDRMVVNPLQNTRLNIKYSIHSNTL